MLILIFNSFHKKYHVIWFLMCDSKYKNHAETPNSDTLCQKSIICLHVHAYNQNGHLCKQWLNHESNIFWYIFG